MTDGQLLFAVFSFFYLVECLHWVPLGSILFRTWSGHRHWLAQTPLPFLSAPGRGIGVAWPFPPLGGFLVADGWPIIPDEQGLWVVRSPVQRLSWTELVPWVEKTQVHLTKTSSVACSSPRAARLLLAFLREAQTTQGQERLCRIEAWWQQSIDLPAARAAVRRYRIVAPLLRWPCCLMFVICFVVLPFLFWYYNGGAEVIPGFAAVLMTAVVIGVTWRRLDRRLFLEERRWRWPQVLHLLVVPAHSIRAHDLVGMELLAGIHPIAAAASLLSRQKLTAAAAGNWRRWRFMGPQDSLAAAAPLVVARLLSLYDRLGLIRSELEAGPERQPSTQSYCPCCHAQFQLASATCRDCNGTETVVW